MVFNCLYLKILNEFMWYCSRSFKESQENKDEHQSEQPIIRPRFELGASRIQVYGKLTCSVPTWSHCELVKYQL